MGRNRKKGMEGACMLVFGVLGGGYLEIGQGIDLGG